MGRLRDEMSAAASVQPGTVYSPSGRRSRRLSLHVPIQNDEHAAAAQHFGAVAARLPTPPVSALPSSILSDLPGLMSLGTPSYPPTPQTSVKRTIRVQAPPNFERSLREPCRKSLRPLRSRHRVPLRPLGKEKLACLTARSSAPSNQVVTDWWLRTSESSTVETPRLKSVRLTTEQAMQESGTRHSMARGTLTSSQILKPRAPQPSCWNNDDRWTPKLSPCSGGASVEQSTRLCQHRGPDAGFGQPVQAWRMKRLYVTNDPRGV